MKKAILSFLLTTFYFLSFSQSFKVTTSEMFKEKIGIPALYLKNGNSFFYNFNDDEKTLSFTCYNQGKNKIYTKEINFSKITIKDIGPAFDATHIDDEADFIFTEMNNKVVLFIQHRPKEPYQMAFNQQKLRVIINPSDGAIESEELVSPEKSTVTRFYNHPLSSGYSILSYKSKLRGEKLPTINIRYYSKNHTLISDFKFDLLNYIDITVIGSYYTKENHLILVSVFKKENAEKVLVISKINLDTKATENKEIATLNDDNDFSYAKIAEIPNTDILNVCYYIKTGVKSNKVFYDIIFQDIDIKKLAMGKNFSLNGEKLDVFVKEKCNIKDGYRGGFIATNGIDNKGNLFVTRAKNVLSINGPSIDTKNPELVGIELYDNQGKELNAWAFPYNCTGSSFRSGNLFATTNLSDFAFKPIFGDKNYLVLNDLDKNIDIPLDEKPSFARITDECNAMVVSFTDNGQVKKDFLFGIPSDKKHNKYCDFHTSYYDEATKTLISIVYEGNGYKNGKVAWVKFE